MHTHEITLKAAFLYWLKLGFISFGGPAGQIALMHTELVEKRRWISEARFLHALNYCMLLPGPEATQLAIYIGWLMHKNRGGIMAGLLFVLPGLLILMLLSWIYMVFGDNTVLKAMMSGIKPAVVAIVLAAAWRIAQRTLKTRVLVVVALAAFVAIAWLHLPFPLVIIAAACTGLVFRKYCNTKESVHHQTTHQHLPAIIDDDTPTPEHARFSWLKLIFTLSMGAMFAVSVWLLLACSFSLHHPLADMASFFSKAAILSFGGAYAVLPYMVQAAVEQYHWLSTAQMMDGLALGETTPGPLIMIVAFVGFIGGWNQAFLGGGHLLLAASLGASVACFFTFLPSFIFILAGGPLVESGRNNLHLNAPLNAISAAVVGVIISLVWLFACHVFFKDVASLNIQAIVLTALASVAVFKFKLSTVRLLAASASAGYLLSLLS
ncbi:chromate efflux transporter [Undibacterium sp. JH2W]|uniref:chromate efflux transporter n=1 Tax=Undibacterium sp. JH2W TaxID=3413037 RepID=UPI003BEFFEF4